MFCFKCGTRLADDAAFCFNCGNKVGAADPVVEQAPAVELASVFEATPMVEAEPVFETAPVEVVSIMETAPMFEHPSTPAVSLAKESNMIAPEMVATPPAPSVAPQQPAYEQNSYMMQGSFQMPQHPQGVSQQAYGNPNMPQHQQMYPNAGMPQQAYYNAPVQTKKKSEASVPSMILLVLALISSIVISIGHFVDGQTGMGIANIGYFAASVGLIVFCVSSKKMCSMLKGVFLLVVLGVNIAFAGISAISSAFDIIGNAKAGIDYYYAIVVLLQYVFLYVYLLISIVRSFMGKAKPAYFSCLCGYFAILLTVAAFVIDAVSDTPSIFVFSIIPVDLGIITLIGGDILATLRKGKKLEE